MKDLSTALAQYKCTVVSRDRFGSAGLEYDRHSDFIEVQW